MNKKLIHTVELYQKIENNIIEWMLYYGHRFINRFFIDDWYFNNKGFLFIKLGIKTKDKESEIHTVGVGINKRDFMYKNEYENLMSSIEYKPIISIFEYRMKYDLDYLKVIE